MNKKTFSLATLFLLATLVWLGVNIYWLWTDNCSGSVFDLIIALLFVVAASGMVYNETNKKKRRHLADVDKRQIP